MLRIRERGLVQLLLLRVELPPAHCASHLCFVSRPPEFPVIKMKHFAFEILASNRSLDSLKVGL